MAADKKKILVIDDDPELREALKTILERKGYQVLTAKDGNIGLATAEREAPDLVLTDLMMPKKSGFLVLEKLKTRKSGVRVIMMTANEGTRHRAYAEILGVDDYFCKPFDMEKMLASIARLCPLNSTAEPEK